MLVTRELPLPTFLDVVNSCDNVRVHQRGPVASQFDNEKLVPLHLTDSSESPAIGLLRPIVLERLYLENDRSSSLGHQGMWVFHLEASSHIPRQGRPLGPSVSLQSWLDTHTKRSSAFKELCERWRDTGIFSEVCGPEKWRDETYPIYADPFGPHDHPDDRIQVSGKQINFVFEMERSACALFGFVTYGVHMSIYKEVEVYGKKTLQVWVPTRSRTKPTFPGFLDNSVAGGIPSGTSAFEAMVKECMEEASISEDVVRKFARATGAISYYFRTKLGWLQPEIEYVYDVQIPPDADPAPFEPRPLDGEVESFELLPHDVIIGKMYSGLFKPNCALVLIDLLLRLGYITPNNEPDYMKILTRLHGRFDIENW